MQADPASPTAAEDGPDSAEEYGFEIPVMSPEVRYSLKLFGMQLIGVIILLQSVERASFAKNAIESHYELLLKNAQAATPINTHQSQTLHLTVFVCRIHTHHQAAEERRLKLLQELSERGASQTEVVPS